MIDGIVGRLTPRTRQRAVNMAANWFEEAAYMRLAATGFEPTTIIDVGAFEGGWTRMVRRHFPHAQSLMIEAQTDKAPLLEQTCIDVPGTRHVQALVGRESGREVVFYEMSTGSSMMPEFSDIARVEQYRTLRTLDEIVAEAPVRPGVILKLDVQGAELEVLGGADATIALAAVIQVEMAITPYNANAPTMVDVMKHLENLSFVPYDICGFSRPNNQDLAQIDMLFVPDTSPLQRRFFRYN